MERTGNDTGHTATFATSRCRGPLFPMRPLIGNSGGKDLADCLERLTDRLDQLEFTFVELMPSEGALQDGREELDARLARIEARLDALGEFPQDSIDLGPIVSELTAARHRGAEMLDRVDSLGARIAGLELPTQQTARLRSIETRLAALDSLPAQVGTVLEGLGSETLARQRQDIARLGEMLRQVQKRVEGLVRDRPLWLDGVSMELAEGADGRTARLQSALAGGLEAHARAMSEARAEILSRLDDLGAAIPADDAAAVGRLHQVATEIDAARASLARQVAALADRTGTQPDPQEWLGQFEEESGHLLRRLEGIVTNLAAEHGRLQCGAQAVPAELLPIPLPMSQEQEDADASAAHQLVRTVSRLAEANNQLVDIARTTPEAIYDRQEQFLADLRAAVAGIFNRTDLRKVS